MLSFFKKFFHHWDDVDVGDYPGIHSFPNVGPNGEITIDCVIRPTAWSDGKQSAPHQPLDGRGQRIAAKRVGTMAVEIDEYGLYFRWQPGEVGDELFRFPALTTPRMKPATDPTENRRDECDVNPLKNADVDIHSEGSNV